MIWQLTRPNEGGGLHDGNFSIFGPNFNGYSECP